MIKLVHAAGIAATVAAVTAATHVDDAHAATPTAPAVTVPAWVLTPCKAEDSTDCQWDAATRGNGGGHSFATRKLGRVVCVFYVDARFAAQHDGCGVSR